MLIVTNNIKVADKYRDVVFVKGSPLDVMQKACSLSVDDYSLVAAPLLGNLVMLRNPFRSIVMERKSTDAPSTHRNELLSDMYRRCERMDKWKTPDFTTEDYAYMDAIFVEQVRKEAGL